MTMTTEPLDNTARVPLSDISKGVDNDVLAPVTGVTALARIGQPVWYVERRSASSGILEPTIVQTLVSRLQVGGKVGVVNHSDKTLYFDRAEAEAAWHADRKILREIYASWEEHLAKEVSPEAIDAMIHASLERGSTDNSWNISSSREFSTFPAPDSLPEPRFLPGQRVWAVCLEKTRSIFGRSPDGVCRVISATVNDVSVNRHSETPKLSYSLDSAFGLDDEMIFATRQDAEEARVAVIRSRIAELEAALTNTEPVLELSSDEDAARTFDELFEGDADALLGY